MFKLSKHQKKRVRIDCKYRLFPFRFAVEQCVDCLRHPRLRPADQGNGLVFVHAEHKRCRKATPEDFAYTIPPAFLFTDRLIRFDWLYCGNDHKSLDLLVQAKLERLKLLRRIIFTAADHRSVAVAIAHFIDPGHGLCSDLIAQGVHDHSDDPALSGLERSGNAAGHIVILPDHLFIIKQKLLPDTKK